MASGVWRGASICGGGREAHGCYLCNYVRTLTWVRGCKVGAPLEIARPESDDKKDLYLAEFDRWSPENVI